MIQEKRSRTCARGAPPSPSSPSCREELDQSKTGRRLPRFLSNRPHVLYASVCVGQPSAGVRQPVIPRKRAAPVRDEAEWRKYGYPLFRGDIGVDLTVDLRKRPESCCGCSRPLLAHRCYGEAIVRNGLEADVWRSYARLIICRSMRFIAGGSGLLLSRSASSPLIWESSRHSAGYRWKWPKQPSDWSRQAGTS